ncbi:hypothetical protein ACFXK0_09050 [Nocardia sp. NPDC059177]|uniref:hypothetical protein n=1 Tax=Nocardia sp. NPDC059177 TaxID=3346759 RepID=UPI0036C34638
MRTRIDPRDVTGRPGPPRSHRRPTPAAAEAAKPRARVLVRQALDFFERCPACDYPAEATETVVVLGDGRVATTLLPTCGLPCGWHGQPRPHVPVREPAGTDSPSAQRPLTAGVATPTRSVTRS